MEKSLRRIVNIIMTVLGIWAFLTIWAEVSGKKTTWQIGNPSSPQKALIVFDPDPFYNLDEQLCQAFGEELGANNYYVTIASASAAKILKNQPFDLYVLCANTYNWRPDWAISRLIKKHLLLKNKPVVAITLGSGSTNASKKAFEKIILKKEATLIDSKAYWLLRPNDESRMNEKNVQVAQSMVREWAKKLSNEKK